ncbi:MAG TPA: PP2C family protein-serine/threonine phosphatase [Thermoanaerobaculia bacterium]|jgi:sigma-B regulation protein RsbU (phosphoserine phosphatase)|nr:PP2C family protein-serine/threonine phosphatase [Thermoanaerobaculia bacterium]
MATVADRPVDYRELMKKVERLVAAIQRVDDIETTVNRVAGDIIAQFRDELGLVGGRLYAREQTDYILRATFGDAKPVQPGLRVPRAYAPIDACVAQGVVYMEPDDPGVDRALEENLGVREFACIEVGDDDYILAFNVDPIASREDIVFSLQILRNAINQKVRQERMEEVFREARKIQASILPRKMPAYPPFEMAGRTEPMDKVGGDFFDLIPLTDKILGLAIADVSGHGLPAALQVRDVHMGLRMGMARDFKIVRTVERLNGIIHKSTLTSRFVALFYGELELNGTFIYVNAGHIAPFHLQPDGTARFLGEGGPVLGPLAGATYERGFVKMQPGDLLVMFTDGIVESRQQGQGEELGTDRLLELARELRGRRPAEVVAGIFARLEQWTGGSPPEDDRTVLVVSYPPNDPAT